MEGRGRHVGPRVMPALASEPQPVSPIIKLVRFELKVKFEFLNLFRQWARVCEKAKAGSWGVSHSSSSGVVCCNRSFRNTGSRQYRLFLFFTTLSFFFFFDARTFCWLGLEGTSSERSDIGKGANFVNIRHLPSRRATVPFSSRKRHCLVALPHPCTRPWNPMSVCFFPSLVLSVPTSYSNAAPAPPHDILGRAKQMHACMPARLYSYQLSKPDRPSPRMQKLGFLGSFVRLQPGITHP